MKSEYTAISPYITKDGSVIRELMHPAVHGNAAQSLAEAFIPVGAATLFHLHSRTEELYHITVGSGIMFLGDEQFPVREGDTICILPGTPHRIENTGNEPLKILCCCAPAYSHEDTQLIEQKGISS